MRAIVLLALGAMACAPVEAPGTGDPLTELCNLNALSTYVGRTYTDALRPAILERGGVRIARVIRPNDVVTMDYRGDRLNIHLLAGDQIERFSCG